jgi:hypothetical protein
MAEFAIWAKVEQMGPGQFLAIAAAVPTVRGQSKSLVKSVCCESREAAEKARNNLARSLGETLTLRGDRVTDVEAE